jgi:uncharacterized protein (TIGR02270 family)
VQRSSTNRVNSAVVRQHAEESVHLWSIRDGLLRAPHVTLRDLRAHDRRIAAHLDGVALAAEAGWRMCQQLLEDAGGGEVFSATVRALEDQNADRVVRMLALAATDDTLRSAAASAFGWVSAERLHGVVKALLVSDDPSDRWFGVTACAMHRVDPGLKARRQFADLSALVRGRALRTSGEIGCSELAPALGAAQSDLDADCRFWASWSAVLVGDRGMALQRLTDIGLAPGPHRARAFLLALQTMNMNATRAFLRGVAQDSDQLRWLIHGAGIAGDAAYAAWLIHHMTDRATARVAGEAFAMITGVDLAMVGLELEGAWKSEAGPTDDPDDPNVEMDPDDELPWPDVTKIRGWWERISSHFEPGTRYFMGAPVTRDHCIDVLKNGCQRQRILAAHYLCLLEPGTPLFNTSAPAWRQQQLLDRMV